MLNYRQRETLIHLARSAVTAAVEGNTAHAPQPQDDALCRPSGAFVTLRRGGELRGCIGMIEPNFPLYETVQQVAVSAATQDFRFPPLHPSELLDIRLEISVLSSLQKTDDLSTIQVGTHGLVVERGIRRGLLLPQVAREYGWERDEFLSHTCEKAGLSPSAWKEGVAIYTFSAEVFGEEEQDPAEHYIYLNYHNALCLIQRHLTTKNLIKHSLAAGAVLKKMAVVLQEDPAYWKLCGLVHDLDYDVTVNEMDRHTLVTEEILIREGISGPLVDAVKAHNNLAPRDTALAKALWATDPLTGFLVAAALVTKDKKLANVDVPFVVNRMKEKSFARAVNRDQIADCKELGLTLEQFITIGLEAMQEIAPDLGL